MGAKRSSNWIEIQRQLLECSKPRPQEALHTSSYSLEALPSSREQAETSLVENERAHEEDISHPG